MANALLENEKSSCNENNTPMFCFISLIFFVLTPDLFFLAGGRCWFEWEEFSPEEISGAKARSPFAFLSLSFLNLQGKVGYRPGMDTVALEVSFSAWVVTAPYPPC